MASVELLKVLNDTGNSLIKQIRQNMDQAGQKATGKTSQSLRYEIKEGGTKVEMSLFGRPFFAVVETGRKATPDKKPGRAMLDNIKEWLSARGKPESLTWAIAMSIQKKGTKLWQAGGRKDIFTSVVKDPTMIEKLSQEILKTFAADYVRQIKLIFK